jgi:hypothetical protein
VLSKKTFFTIVITIIGIIYFKKNDKFYYQLQVEKNYGYEINKAAIAFDIDPNYLKALCLLESSGELPAGKRFEKKVYNDLKQLRARKIKKYSGLTPDMIKNASDEALKNALAAFYLKSGTADNSVEFFHKSFGEFLCAERMAETLEEFTFKSKKRGKTYEMATKELEWQIYDLFGYGNLTAEIVEYLMALLIKNEIFELIYATPFVSVFSFSFIGGRLVSCYFSSNS